VILTAFVAMLNRLKSALDTWRINTDIWIYERLLSATGCEIINTTKYEPLSVA